MRILITGSNGMLGSDLVRVIGACDEIVGMGRGDNHNTGLTYFPCDIRNRDKVFEIVASIKADWIIHGAALTDVDGCENDPKLAEAINVDGTAHVAEACRNNRMRGIFISTDYAFDGKKDSPYEEADSPNPISVYGSSKFKGEQVWQGLVRSGIILRSSWLFGRDGRNFVKSIRENLIRKNNLDVVADQWGCPTSTVDLAGAIHRLIHSANEQQTQIPPILHFTNSGATSRYEWAKFIAGECGLYPNRIKPVRTEQTGRAARRPQYGVLGTGLWKKLFKESPRDIWQATSDYIRNELMNTPSFFTKDARA